MDLYDQVLENNVHWAALKAAADPGFFKRLSKHQEPEFLYIGCSDSRVHPNNFLALEPGHVFMHKNIANLVIPEDLSVKSVVYFATVHLKVKHVIVCGHYGCGGIQAAMKHTHYGCMDPWLGHIRKVEKTHESELKELPSYEIRHNRLVELNVLEQCRQMERLLNSEDFSELESMPKIHAWVYNLENGLLKVMNYAS